MERMGKLAWTQQDPKGKGISPFIEDDVQAQVDIDGDFVERRAWSIIPLLALPAFLVGGVMPPKFPAHQFATEPVTTSVIREVKSIWPFFLGFGVVGYAMAKLSVPTEEDLRKSTITPHEDKAMASTA